MSKFDGRIKLPGESRFLGTNVNRNKGTRIVRIKTVHTDTGTVDVEYLDGQGTRENVVVASPSSTTFSLPTEGNIALMQFTVDNRGFIVGYLPTNLKTAYGVSPEGTKQIPSSSEGTTSMQDSVGNGINFNPLKGLEFLSKEGGSVTITPANNTVTTSDMNHDVKTEAGTLHFGVVERELPPSGQAYFIDTFGRPYKGSPQKGAVEFNLKIARNSDLDATTDAPINDPVVTIQLGSIIDDSGVLTPTERVRVGVRNTIGVEVASISLSDLGNVIVTGSNIFLNGENVLMGKSPNVVKDKTTVKFSELKEIINTIGDVINHISVGSTADANAAKAANRAVWNTAKAKIDNLITAMEAKHVRVN